MSASNTELCLCARKIDSSALRVPFLPSSLLSVAHYIAKGLLLLWLLWLPLLLLLLLLLQLMFAEKWLLTLFMVRGTASYKLL